jgi:hypothetical protein
MEQRALKNVNNCLNTNIYSYFETSGSISYNPHLNVVHFFNTSVNWTSVAAEDNCFPAMVYNMRCAVVESLLQSYRRQYICKFCKYFI